MMEKEGSDLIQMRQDLRCRNYSFGRKLLDWENILGLSQIALPCTASFWSTNTNDDEDDDLGGLIIVCQMSDDTC